MGGDEKQKEKNRSKGEGSRQKRKEASSVGAKRRPSQRHHTKDDGESSIFDGDDGREDQPDKFALFEKQKEEMYQNQRKELAKRLIQESGAMEGDEEDSGTEDESSDAIYDDEDDDEEEEEGRYEIDPIPNVADENENDVLEEREADKGYFGEERGRRGDAGDRITRQEVSLRMLEKIREEMDAKSKRERKEIERERLQVDARRKTEVENAKNEAIKVWERERTEAQEKKLSTFEYDFMTAGRILGYLAQIAAMATVHYDTAVRVAAITAHDLITHLPLELGDQSFAGRATTLTSMIQDMGGSNLTPGAEIFSCCNTARVILLRAIAVERFAAVVSMARTPSEVLEAMNLFKQICAGVTYSVTRDENAANPGRVPKDQAFKFAAKAANNTYYMNLLFIHIAREGVPGAKKEQNITRSALGKRVEDLLDWIIRAFRHPSIERDEPDAWFDATLRKMCKGIKNWREVNSEFGRRNQV